MNARRTKLFEVLELQGRDAPNLGDVTDRLRDLKEQHRKLTEEAARLREAPQPLFQAGDEELAAISDTLREIITDRSDVRRVRSMLQRLLKSVVLHSDRAEIVYRTGLLADGGQQVVHSSTNWLGD